MNHFKQFDLLAFYHNLAYYFNPLLQLKNTFIILTDVTWILSYGKTLLEE